jgi:hypothetical protein
VGILKTWDCDADVTCVLLPFAFLVMTLFQLTNAFAAAMVFVCSRYHEDPGQPHWYFEVLFNKHVQSFLDRVYFSSSLPVSSSSANIDEVTGGNNVNIGVLNPQEEKMKCFTLTVAVPAESGSLNGWQIRALKIPGL